MIEKGGRWSKKKPNLVNVVCERPLMKMNDPPEIRTMHIIGPVKLGPVRILIRTSTYF